MVRIVNLNPAEKNMIETFIDKVALTLRHPVLRNGGLRVWIDMRDEKVYETTEFISYPATFELNGKTLRGYIAVGALHAGCDLNKGVITADITVSHPETKEVWEVDTLWSNDEINEVFLLEGFEHVFGYCFEA